MKSKIVRLFRTVIVVTITALISVTTYGQDISPTGPDFEFSHDVKHYPIGSKVVLIFQSDTMIVGNARFGVSADNVDTNIEMLNKFLKWAELAKQRGDELTKEIGTVRGFDYGLFDFWNKYEFLTSKTLASTSYVLCIQPGNMRFGMFNPKSVDDNTQAGGPITFKMYFGQEQVRQIIQRMQDFKAGKLKSNEESAAAYN